MFKPYAILAAAAVIAAGCSAKPLDQDLNLVGTEPFWAVQISKDKQTTVFSRPGEKDLSAGYPVESKIEGASVLTAASPEGDIVMTLRKGECMDGMSNRKYPWTAEVAFAGQTYKGCAGPPQPGGDA